MKNLLLVFLLLTTLFSTAQTTIRVTNGQSLQTVIDNAIAGSTIIVEAGSYGDININKKVELIGTGYYLSNTNSAYIGVSVLGTVNFQTGSNFSRLQGFQTSDINIGATGVWVQRNKCATVRIGHNGLAEVKADNVLVRQNIGGRPEVYSTCANFSIKNNIFYAGFYFNTGELGDVSYNLFDCDLSGNDSYTANYINVQFKSNIFGYLHSAYNAYFINFYIPYVVERNVFSGFSNLGPPYPATLVPSNSVTSFTNMYLGYPNNPNNLQEDARFQLSANSPAKGAGENGTDCGAFGGEDPYILSGIPSIPSITQLTPDAKVQTGTNLNVRIKAKTNN